MQPAAGKSIGHYYLAAFTNSFSSCLFLYCAYFWAKQDFGYTDTENLVMGGLQGLAAIIAARFGGNLGDRFGYTRLLMLILPAVSATLLAGSILRWHFAPMAVTILYLGLITATWPNVEASVMHAPSRLSMPVRLGLYNMTWSFASASGFFAGGFIFSRQPLGILWVPAALHLFIALWLRAQRDAPDRPDLSAMAVGHRGQAVPREEKKSFLHTAWMANAVSYFMSTAFLALAPELGERFGLSATHAIWLSCSLLFARGFAFILFWRWEGWHYRRLWSHAAIWLAPACLALIFFATWIPLIVAAFVCFGLASGLTYYTSIYYSLDYGENKGEHGGLHESILAFGILLGPLAGALGSKLFGGTVGGQLTIVLCSMAISAMGLAAWGRAPAAQGSR